MLGIYFHNCISWFTSRCSCDSVGDELAPPSQDVFTWPSPGRALISIFFPEINPRTVLTTLILLSLSTVYFFEKHQALPAQTQARAMTPRAQLPLLPQTGTTIPAGLLQRTQIR